jgi:ketosteroid isomerase-like protein
MTRRETVQAIYAAFGRGDIPAILDKLADDVQWEHDATNHGIALLTPRRGRRDVGNFFEALGAIDITQFDLVNLHEGGDQVVAVFRITHKHRKTGKTFQDLELHLWSFDDRGQVSAFRHVVDTHGLWLQQQG